MPNYKRVRLEESVYNDLAKRQLPRESISRTIERLIKSMDILGRLTSDLLENLKGGPQ